MTAESIAQTKNDTEALIAQLSTLQQTLEELSRQEAENKQQQLQDVTDEQKMALDESGEKSTESGIQIPDIQIPDIQIPSDIQLSEETKQQIQAALDGVSEIVIFNRKDEFWDRAVSTVEKINTRTSSHAVLYDLADLDKLKEEMDDSYLFVNATGVGMKPLEGQSVVPDKSYFRPELIVVDVPYSPLETKMRSMAKEVGCKTMNGLGMMLFQGSAAFELWTGEPMPIEHMKEVLNIKYD